MKASQRDFANVARRSAGDIAIAFFCGPDEAGASAAAAKLVEMLPDAGERIEMGGSQLKSDPASLLDEARSASLFGGARHILARVSGEEAHDAVKTWVEMADLGQAEGACPILIVATSATDKSRTAKLLAARKDALVAMFYPPDLKSLTADVRAMADAAGLRLGGDIAERIARGAGLDVRLARSEVEKLALYLDADPQSPRLADADALDAIGASTEEDGFMPLVNAVLSGETRKLPGELARMREVGLNPVGVALALERRAAQLAGLAGKLGRSNDVAALLDRERVWHSEKRDVGVQLRRWNARKLDRLISRLARLHADLLGNSQSAELLLSQALTEITRYAAPRR